MARNDENSTNLNSQNLQNSDTSDVKSNGANPNSPVYEDPWALVEENLKLYNLISVDVAGDGNCQFRALALQMNMDQNEHTCVRGNVVKEMREFPTRYEQFYHESKLYGPWDEYLRKLESSGDDVIWGNNITLQAAANNYKRAINVVQNTTNIIVAEPITKENEDLWVSYLPEKHYRGTILIPGSEHYSPKGLKRIKLNLQKHSNDQHSDLKGHKTYHKGSSFPLEEGSIKHYYPPEDK